MLLLKPWKCCPKLTTIFHAHTLPALSTLCVLMGKEGLRGIGPFLVPFAAVLPFSAQRNISAGLQGSNVGKKEQKSVPWMFMFLRTPWPSLCL